MKSKLKLDIFTCNFLKFLFNFKAIFLNVKFIIQFFLNMLQNLLNLKILPLYFNMKNYPYYRD